MAYDRDLTQRFSALSVSSSWKYNTPPPPQENHYSTEGLLTQDSPPEVQESWPSLDAAAAAEGRRSPQAEEDMKNMETDHLPEVSATTTLKFFTEESPTADGTAVISMDTESESSGSAEEDISFRSSSISPECRIICPQNMTATIANKAMTLQAISAHVEADATEFLQIILSLKLTALCPDYRERDISEHLWYYGFSTFGVDGFKYNMLPSTYRSHQQYRSAYLPLIVYDSWASIVDDFHSPELASTRPHSVAVQVRNIITQGDSLIVWLGCQIERADVHLHCEQLLVQSWIVLLQAPPATTSNGSSANDGESAETTMALGYVDTYENSLNLYNPELAFKMFSSVPPAFHKQPIELNYAVRLAATDDNLRFISANQCRWLLLKPVYYYRPTVRLVETLTLMRYKSGFESAFLQPNLDVAVLDTDRPTGFQLYKDGETMYNLEQKKAIVACFNAVERESYFKNKTVMIQGPPGTGKTHTLVGIVKNLFANCPPHEPGTEPLRILICAASNGAIDEIALRLIAERSFLRELGIDQGDLRIIRLGQLKKIHPAVRDYQLEILVGTAFSGRQRKEIRNDLLFGAHVILSTLSSVQTHTMEIFRQIPNAFRCLIVDEASQCTELELLMPLVYPISKLILIGDHKQLPATVISNTALRQGYGRSMFERLYLHYEAMNRPEVPLVIQLFDQFRMHKAICTFPSAHFYHGTLKTCGGVGQSFLVPLAPYLVFDVTNAKEAKTTDRLKASTLNTEEAAFIRRLLVLILEKLGYSMTDGKPLPARLPVSIGVITFYSGQKEELIRQLKEYRGGALLNYVDVNTVDAFQGQERDIAVLSCVRAFEEADGDVGFVKSQQRMNVALTRAKSALYVAIHARSFTDVPHWKEMLQDAQERDCYVKVNRKISNCALLKKMSV